MGVYKKCSFQKNASFPYIIMCFSASLSIPFYIYIIRKKHMYISSKGIRFTIKAAENDLTNSKFKFEKSYLKTIIFSASYIHIFGNNC